MNSLKRGAGEAYLIVKNNPQIDFSNQIIKGVLNIYAYDGQCEHDRARYIFDIISISKHKDKIREALLEGLATEQTDTWNLTHLFAIAKFFAQQNDIEIKQAIYDRFLNNPIEGSDWVGFSEILELGGIEGLLFIAEKFGRYITENPDNWQDDWIIKCFQEENQDLDVGEILEKFAKSNEYIRIYLDNIDQTKASREKHNPKVIKYADIIDEVLNSNPFFSFKRKRNLTKKEIKLIAQRLVQETDKSNIEKLLEIFDSCKFPLDSNYILNLAKRRKTSKNRIAEYAIDALKYLSGKNIRMFALERVQKSNNSIDYLGILTSNYQKGDFKLLCDIANKTNNEHKIEQLARIYTDVYKANKTKECKEPLEILYNKMNCAIHRNGIVEILIENDVLSDKIKEEIKFDSDAETRQLIG